MRLLTSGPGHRRTAPGSRILQRPALPARACAVAASAMGSLGTAYMDSGAPHAGKPCRQHTMAHVVNSLDNLMPQPEHLKAIALAATMGLLATRVCDGKGQHSGFRTHTT